MNAIDIENYIDPKAYKKLKRTLKSLLKQGWKIGIVPPKDPVTLGTRAIGAIEFELVPPQKRS